jgi:hypothetical protein
VPVVIFKHEQVQISPFNLLMKIFYNLLSKAKKKASAFERSLIKTTFANKYIFFFLISLQPSIDLVKKLEEVRLSESRRSPRLADQDKDTDFARLADMAGDRRRSSSHSIDVPMQFTQNG